MSERSDLISTVNRRLNHTRLDPDHPIRSRRNKVVERNEVSDSIDLHFEQVAVDRAGDDTPEGRRTSEP